MSELLTAKRVAAIIGSGALSIVPIVSIQSSGDQVFPSEILLQTKSIEDPASIKVSLMSEAASLEPTDDSIAIEVTKTVGLRVSLPRKLTFSA